MTYFAIKIVAMICMVIDHVGYLLLGNIPIYRLIGRVAFPLFAFLLVNGFHHTSNKIKYLIRMIGFAVISDVIFDFTFYGGINFAKQNVFFTLTLGLLSMIVTEKFKEYVDNKYKAVLRLIIKLFGVLIILGSFMIVNYIIRAEFGWYGFLLIYLIYLSYGTSLKNKAFMCLGIIVANFVNILLANAVFQAFSILSITIILFFKDEKVSIPKVVRWFCYMFYPLHLVVIGLLNMLM